MLLLSFFILCMLCLDRRHIRDKIKFYFPTLKLTFTPTYTPHSHSHYTTHSHYFGNHTPTHLHSLSYPPNTSPLTYINTYPQTYTHPHLSSHQHSPNTHFHSPTHLLTSIYTLKHLSHSLQHFITPPTLTTTLHNTFTHLHYLWLSPFTSPLHPHSVVCTHLHSYEFIPFIYTHTHTYNYKHFHTILDTHISICTHLHIHLHKFTYPPVEIFTQEHPSTLTIFLCSHTLTSFTQCTFTITYTYIHSQESYTYIIYPTHSPHYIITPS